MKNKLLIGFAAVAALAAGALLMYYLYTVRSLDLYGQTVRADVTEYTLTEDVKGPLDNMIRALSQLEKLKKLDLGPTLVEAREEEKLRAAFPGVELTYGTYVSLYGLSLRPDITELNLSGTDISDISELRAALPYLKSLTLVRSTGNVLPLEDLKALRADFPQITFSIIASVQAFGLTLRDDTETLDLRNAEWDGTLADNLRLLPALREADLRGQPLSMEEKLALVREFPGIAFRWEVLLGGKIFDSYAEELDLSGNRDVSTDQLRKAAPLFPRLTRLILTGSAIPEEDAEALRAEFPGVEIL